MESIGRRRALAAGAGLAALALPGCDTAGQTDPRDRGPLSVSTLVFAAEEPGGYGEYVEREDAAFSVGESLWAYVELEGLAGRPREDGVEVQLTQRVVLEHRTRGVVSEDENVLERTVPRDRLDAFAVWSEFELEPGTSTGEYTLTVEFTDAVSESSDGATGTFTVEE